MKLPVTAQLAKTRTALGVGLLLASVNSYLKSATADRGFPLVTSYSSTEVGADTFGLGAIQDTDGVLYFGSHSLLTFNGDRWRSFSVAGSYALRGLAFGSEGRLWAAAVGEIGWFQKDRDIWSYHSLIERLPAEHANVGEIFQAFADGEGAVFVSDTKIFRWDGMGFQVWTLPGARRLRAQQIDGQIYFQHAPTGIYELTPAGPRLAVSTAMLGDVGICFWMGRNDGTWIILVQQGFLRFADGRWTKLTGDAAAYLQGFPPTRVLQLRDGRLAVGTTNNGLVVITPDGRIDTLLDEAHGFSERYVVPLVEDHDGGLWVGSTVALSRVALSPITTVFDHRAHFPNQPVTKIVRHDGDMVFATTQGFFGFDSQTQRFTTDQPITSAARDLQSSPAGLLVAGSHGVKRVSNGAATELYYTLGMVFSIAPTLHHPDRSYIADGMQILELSHTGASRLLVTGLPDYANSIAEDASGRLWIGTKSRGLFLATIGNSAVVAARPSAEFGVPNPSGETRVASVAGGAVLMFDPAGGWLLPRGARHFVQIDGHPARTVAAVSPDPRNSSQFWIVHPASARFAATVARLTVHQSHAQWEPHAIDGLSAAGTPRSLLVEAHNEAGRVLWIGGTAAVIRHEFDGTLLVPTPRAPLLRSEFRRAGSDEPLPVVGALPASARSISFEFASPEFSRRAALRLETRIDPIDPDWIPAATDSRRELTAVRDGHYTFRVRAVAATGQAGPPAELAFDVQPPWWRTPGFLVALALALLPLGYGLYWLRVRTLRRRNVQLEAKVRERTEELVQANAAKTRFVSNISHDIRNPLNGIVGLTLALEDTPLEERQKQLVSTLRECTTYLSTLVDDVLDFASIEAGRVELRPGRFAPEQLLQSVIQTLKSDTAASGANLLVDLAPNLPPSLVGDAGRIQQILVNFVSNALKYAGGTIHLSASITADSPHEVEFAVRDEGPGISAEGQALLFTRFSRLRQRTGGEEVPGAGLGLASCRLLADLMGGSVAVESEVGAGARFVVRLPLEIAGPPAEAPTAPLPNSTVLVVEDADYNAWAATAVLAKLGLTGERARTGAEAIEMFRQKRYNVVLLDRNLPDFDGTDVARRMRELESDGTRAIIFAVTAYCTPEDRALCLEAGMDAFVGKPLTPEKLRKVMAAVGQGPLAAASVHVPDETTPAPYDLKLMTFLSSGSPSGLENQIRLLIASLDETAARLQSAFVTRDFERLGDEAHTLHGDAKMVEGRHLVEAAAHLEAAAREEDESACRERIQVVSRELQLLTEAIRPRVPVAPSR